MFDDPLHLSQLDPHSDGDRWQTIGMVGPVLLLVVHTWPEGDEAPVGRIVSVARLRPSKGKPMKKKVSSIVP